MPKLVEAPTVIPAAGAPPKQIEEFAGRASTGHAAVSIAHMVAPAGWRDHVGLSLIHISEPTRPY